MLEKDILKKVIEKLESFKLSGDILWYRRLHNGIFFTRQGYPVTMGAKPDLDDGKDLDIVVIVNCGNGKIAQLHIDTKRSKVKKFDFEQQVFADSMAGTPMTMCVVVNDPGQLWPAIEKAKRL